MQRSDQPEGGQRRSWTCSFRNIDIAKYSLLQESKQKGGYRVLRWSDANGSAVSFFVNQTIDEPDLRPVFREPRFRQALSYAINGKQINQVSYFGLGKERNALLIPESQCYTPHIEALFADYAPEKSNQLLDDLGLKKGADGYRLLASGKPIELTIETIETLSPVGAIVIAVLAFNFLGDGIRDSSLPTNRRRRST